MTTQQPIRSIVRASVALARRERDAIAAAARHVYPEEYCGLLLGRRTGTQFVVEQIVNVPNVAPSGLRRNRFDINPGLLLAWEHLAEKEGLRIVGLVHSCPDHEARPTEEDLARAWPGHVFVTAAVRSEAPVDLACWQFCELTREFEPVTLGE